ncbi:YiiG family protein [Patescibacteria group bacterium]|nr:YiiG family protein [Patescibacteria group bacterium]
MNNSWGKWSLLLAITLVVTLGTTGCVSKIKEAAKSVSESVSSKMSTIDYLNKIVEASKAPSSQVNDWAYASFNSHLTLIESTPKECSYTMELNEMADQSNLLGDKISVEDESVKNKVEPKFKAYIDSYETLREANNKLADYCNRETYKDDDGAQVSPLTEDVKSKMSDFITEDNDLNSTIKEIQRDTDLGIDENSTDPYDVITLASDALTNDIEDAHAAYSSWVTAKADGGNPDASTVKSAEDKLKADMKKYKEKADSVKAEEAESVGSYYTSYISEVDDFDVEYEKFVRDVESGELTTAKANELIEEDQTGITGSAVYGAYSDVIEAHNNIVDAVERYNLYS